LVGIEVLKLGALASELETFHDVWALHEAVVKNDPAKRSYAGGRRPEQLN
jgi:hypothetical protein